MYIIIILNFNISMLINVAQVDSAHNIIIIYIHDMKYNNIIIIVYIYNKPQQQNKQNIANTRTLLN